MTPTERNHMTRRSAVAAVAAMAAMAALTTALFIPYTAFAQQPAPAVTVPPVTAVTNPLAEAIRNRIDLLRYEKQHDMRGARIIVDELVARYYEAQQFQPAWQDPAKLDELVASIDDLRNDGLDPNDYHLEALQSYRLDVRMKSPLTLQDRADLELLATDAFMLGLYHVYLGKVDPVKLSTQWNFAQRPTPSFEEGLQRFSARLAAGQIREAFESARPSHVWYQRGRERLKEYRAIAAAGGWPSIPDGPTIKPGMSDTRVPVLRKRLEVTKDLAPAVGAVAAADPDLYDTTLEQAVKAFQDRHGLTPDGAIGPGTRAAMNVPVAQRVDQIRVNLERARWTLHELKGEFVLVDVAGFYASYFRDDEPIWTSRVVVGRDQRETPIFRSRITYVVFNPTWTIPPGILVKDKLPDLKRNPGALKKMNIRVLDGSGREVNRIRSTGSSTEPHDYRRTSSCRIPGQTTHSAWSRSCSRIRTWCTCTIRRRNRCSSRTSARSARAASVCRRRSNSRSSCSMIRSGTSRAWTP